MRLTGTDAWRWDAPFVHTAKTYAATRGAGLIWGGHTAGRDIGHCPPEKLHKLETLPASGFVISCFPHNSAAPRRDGRAPWQSSTTS